MKDRLFASLLFVLLAFGCVSNPVKEFNPEISKDVCPSIALGEEASNSRADFLLAASGLVRAGDAELKSNLSRELNSRFAGAEQVNKIYAVSFAACVACRTSAASPDLCMSTFKELLSDITKTKTESAAFDDAIKYSKKLMW